MRIIDHDDFDDLLWHEALEQSPTLRDLWNRTDVALLPFRDLLADLFCLLYQPLPRWNEYKLPSASELLLRDLSTASEFNTLKVLTEGDAANATMATGILGRQALVRFQDGSLSEIARQWSEQAEREEREAELKAFDQLADEQDGELPDWLQDQLDTAREATAARGPGAYEADISDEVGVLRRAMRLAAQEASGELASMAQVESALPGHAAGGLREKLQLADRVSGSQKLRQLVELAGRMRRIALAKRASVIKEAREETVGVVRGADISRVLPGELVNLAWPQTRLAFYRSFLEGQLLQVEQQGHERQGGGPIIICIDGSGSMAGPKEIWSKAIVMGYLGIAEKEKRDVRLCQFGGIGEHQMFEFPFRRDPRGVDREQVLDALETFLNAGGTDLEGPLRWAAAQIDGELERGDVVVLTDAECSFSDSFLTWWIKEREQRSFSTFGVLIGDARMADILGKAIEHVTHVSDLDQVDEALDLLFKLET